MGRAGVRRVTHGDLKVDLKDGLPPMPTPDPFCLEEFAIKTIKNADVRAIGREIKVQIRDSRGSYRGRVKVRVWGYE